MQSCTFQPFDRRCGKQSKVYIKYICTQLGGSDAAGEFLVHLGDLRDGRVSLTCTLAPTAAFLAACLGVHGGLLFCGLLCSSLCLIDRRCSLRLGNERGSGRKPAATLVVRRFHYLRGVFVERGVRPPVAFVRRLRLIHNGSSGVFFCIVLTVLLKNCFSPADGQH